MRSESLSKGLEGKDFFKVGGEGFGFLLPRSALNCSFLEWNMSYLNLS